MYFLEKFCRICVQTGVPLVDVSSTDFDSVSLSEKLKVCTKMVITKESISSEICQKCVNQLRVAYHFHEMCKKSTKIIQSYLDQLIGTENRDKLNFTKENDNCQLSVVIEEIPNLNINHIHSKYLSGIKENVSNNQISTDVGLLPSQLGNDSFSCRRKQRITKEKRCSLLKQLLTHKPKKERDKLIYFQENCKFDKGGLKSIINFTKNYEFSFKLDKNSNIESTPLDKLADFSKNYFDRDFTEFHNHVLYIIENRESFENSSVYSSDDEYLSDGVHDIETETEGGGRKQIKFEEVVIEPDIKIKSEVTHSEDEESQCPLDYLETSYEENEEMVIKKEDRLSDSEEELRDKQGEQIFKLEYQTNVKSLTEKSQSTLSTSNIGSSTTGLDFDSTSHSVKLLDRLVSSFPMHSRKVFSPNNVRCRTRYRPYIDPLLKDQFLFRSFKCDRCNRYFKSQGYLKAHASKVH